MDKVKLCTPEKYEVNIKINIKNIDTVSTTLMLPLYFRAIETLRPGAIITDDSAVDLIDQIDYDFSKIAGYRLIQTTTLMRVKEFDCFVIDFLEQNPDAIIVNIGCGLDTRFDRLDNGSIIWYELDFPNVIALRRQFFKETDRHHFIPSSVLDFSWMDAIKVCSSQRLSRSDTFQKRSTGIDKSLSFPVPKAKIAAIPRERSGEIFDPLRLEQTEKKILFIAEGIFMYFKDEDVRKLIQGLKDRFPGSILVFDAVSPFQMLLSYCHPVIMVTGARFHWGLRDSKDIEKWVPGVRLTAERFYFNQHIPRLRWYNLLRLFPHIARGFSVVSYQL